MTTLHDYYNKIISQYKSKNCQIKKFKDVKPNGLSPHLEALNFLMYEWCEDHKDERYKEIFDYIIVPLDCDFDFTSITFEEFFQFLKEKKI
jgi:hypothetical protein